jgi:hypothetical protein
MSLVRFLSARVDRARHDGERGATLILALVVITVVAIVAGALLGGVSANERATVALRGVGGTTYTAEAAAQIAINSLRKGTWNNDTPNCFGSAASMTLNGVYPDVTGGGANSAYVSCVGESGTGAEGLPVAVTDANRPGQAVLTVGTSTSEYGQYYGQSSSNITIRGAVTSNSNIGVKSNSSLTLTGGASVKAVTGCTGPITPACTNLSAPGVPDPNYAAPAASLLVTPESMPKCNNQNQVAEFYPGYYDSADDFNTCKASALHLNPGTYFFDFKTGSHIWTATKPIVGGTLTAPLTKSTTVPGACVNPIESSSAVGVKLVFGGDSQLVLGKGAQFEMCASYSATSIPTVVYGLKSAVINGALTMPAQNGCVVTPGGCDFINNGGNGNQPSFYFEGFVYAPLGRVNIAVNNATQPYFNFGLILRSLQLTSTGSAVDAAYISLPDNSPGFGTASTLVDLIVYVCANQSTCSSAGTMALRVRVRIYDPSGSPVAGARQITVLSWSQLR